MKAESILGNYVPKILIIDDELGASGRVNQDRISFCHSAMIHDVSGDMKPEINRQDAVAEGFFFSGQSDRSSKIYNNLDQTIELIRKGCTASQCWSLILLDMYFPAEARIVDGMIISEIAETKTREYFGLAIMERISMDPELREIPVVVLSSKERGPIEERFSRFGAVAFVPKVPFTGDQLQMLLDRYGLIEDPLLIGSSVEILKCLREARRAARMGNNNILLLGETGTGKEEIAKYIHRQSLKYGRKNAYEMVYVHGVTETLVEDRLFGHNKGSFTDAKCDKPGPAELAHEGTLFIDEFALIPVTIHPKLLRLLDKNVRETQRLGQTKATKVDLLVIMATDDETRLRNSFSKAMLERIAINGAIHVPALDARGDDVLLMANAFLHLADEDKRKRTFGAESGDVKKQEKIRFHEEALQFIHGHHWGGNVRELKYVIEDAVDKVDVKVIHVHHLKKAMDAQPVKQSGRSDNNISKESENGSAKLTQNLATPSGTECDFKAFLKSFDFSLADEKTLKGALPDVQSLIVEYFRAVLRLTCDRNKDKVQPLPAVKFMTGNDKISGTKAYDIIKRLFKLDAETVKDLNSEDLVSKVLNNAKTTRGNKKE